MWLGRVRSDTPGVARLDCVAQSPSAVVLVLFRFGLFLLLSVFLVTGFPAVSDLGEEFADSLDFFFGPIMYPHAGNHDSLRRGDFADCYVAAQSNRS